MSRPALTIRGSFEDRFLHRCGRASGERFMRQLRLVRLLDNLEAQGDDAEVFLPLDFATRVLRADEAQILMDLGDLASSRGCLNWCTLVSRGFRVAVITTGRFMVDADNDLFDRVYRALLRLNLVGDATRTPVGRICNPSGEAAA